MRTYHYRTRVRIGVRIGVRSVTLAFATPLLVLASCAKPAPADAYGNFEAEEVVVSAETSGQIKTFIPVEGQTLVAGIVVAQLDTVPLSLDRAQLVSQRAGLMDRRAEASAQLRALEVQHEIAQRARERVERLFKEQAATSVQRDQTERDERVLAAQITSARASISRSDADVTALNSRVASASDRVQRATVTSPTGGVVLATYVRAGEVVQPGQALYRIANLDTLTLRAYVTGAQLTTFKLGETVQVHIDGADQTLRAFPGIISWISSRAEFTPTPVQTRDARGDLVYAVKVRVPNPDGALKIGMPADVTFAGAPVAAKP